LTGFATAYPALKTTLRASNVLLGQIPDNVPGSVSESRLVEQLEGHVLAQPDHRQLKVTDDRHRRGVEHAAVHIRDRQAFDGAGAEIGEPLTLRIACPAQQPAQGPLRGDPGRVEAVILDLVQGRVDVTDDAALGGVAAPCSPVLVAVIAAGTIAAGHDAGLFVPMNTAWSSATPTASASPSRTSAQMSIAESATTFSGTGTIAASSSATRFTPAHAISVVCLRPVSPATQYA
jgi:hypothetical protein